MNDAVVVTDNPTDGRFEARVDGELVGIADYELTAHAIVFTHTEVSPALEGHGIGSTLIRHALDQVRADGDRRVVPRCPFVRAWIDRHPNYEDLVSRRPMGS